jgi:carbonic anhydrase
VATLLIACVDGRLREALAELEIRVGAEDCDRLLVPGGPLVLTDSAVEQGQVLGWVETVVRGHGVNTVYLVAHQHCLAYQRKLGGFFHDEREIIERDLQSVQKKLRDRLYNTSVECYLVPWEEQVAGGGFGEAEAVS